MHFPLGTALVLAVFGLVFFAIGVHGLYRVWRFYKKMIPVPGTVAECRRVVKGRLVEYLPLVDYQFEGKAYHVLCRTGKPSASKTGEEIELRLDPEHPGAVEAHGQWRLFWACIYTVLGMGLLIFSVFH